MKFIILFTLGAISFAVASPTNRIVNGDEAKPGQFPYQVLLHPHFANGGALCGGIRKYCILSTIRK